MAKSIQRDGTRKEEMGEEVEEEPRLFLPCMHDDYCCSNSPGVKT
jgi:hypothetical protein